MPSSDEIELLRVAAERVARVEAYARRCVVGRAEPTTRGLRAALDEVNYESLDLAAIERLRASNPRIESDGPGTHRLALERLAAVDQYLYDYMNGDDQGGVGVTPDPLPALAMESVRAAQAALRKAIKDGQRVSKTTLGGEITLREERA